MTVGELIERLQRLDPRATAVITAEVPGRGQQIFGIEISDVYPAKAMGWVEIDSDRYHREASRLLCPGHPMASSSMENVVALDDCSRFDYDGRRS